ncbi:MAG: T9SS type A sorting domain-containing protein [Bacteroidia bacterium]|nr:T9SS type A sorting domain-containing protein [Bacteroidia bacterium]
MWAQPDLFFNQGALVYVQAGALVYVQGGMQTNDNGANQGVLENLGEIRCVDGAGGYRGHFKIGEGAEVNSRPNSWIYLQGNYHNIRGHHRSTGTFAANGNTTLGGTVEFNGPNRPQVVSIYVSNATQSNPQNWTFYDVRINNTNNDIAGRFVALDCEQADYNSNGTLATACIDPPDRDMWVANTLTLQSGRIHTFTTSLSNGTYAEVRMLNNDPLAISRSPWPPNSTGGFNVLLAGNDDRYIYGILRRNVVVGVGNAYNFPVGGVPTGTNARGIQGIVVAPSASHYVRVQFDPTVQGPFNQSPYCRPGDPGPNRQYNPLNNGRWEIMPFPAVDATAPSNPSGPSSVTMYNRVVSNAPTTGDCPNAGATSGLPGGSDPYWNNYPTNLCFVGYNQRSAPAGILTPPNNCEGSSTGWTVQRTNFSAYNLNGTYYYATVITHNAPLPSDEIRLTAIPSGSSIALTWEVTPEREYVLGYELYRSTDGLNFSRIAQVDKQGRTTYHHQDVYVQPLTRYFYRVEQHDALGNIRYSNTVEAILPGAGEAFSVQLYPQPFVNEGFLQVNVPSSGLLGFQVYDAAGKLVLKSEYNLTAGSHHIDLSPLLSRVAIGNYNAVVTFGNEVRSIRLIKSDHMH